MKYLDARTRDCARTILYNDEYQLLPIRWEENVEPLWIVDIGGNVGAFTVLAGTLFPSATILCFEPDPVLIPLICHNIQRCKARIIVAQKAALDQDGTARFLVPEHNSPSNCLTGIWPVPDVKDSRTIEVETVDIDRVLREHGFPRIDLLKLDCEGAEGRILERLSATGWLARTGWIRGEWHGEENRRTIERVLPSTHIHGIHDYGAGIGLFIAHARPDRPA